MAEIVTPFERIVRTVTADWRRNKGLPPLASDMTIPASIRKPTSGPCVECKLETDNQDDGDWICEDCLERSRAERREDERLDDPRHTPYGRRK